MMAFVGQWSHALAAILFGAYALWHLPRAAQDTQLRALVTAATLTCFWGLSVAIRGNMALISLIAEHARNLGWIAYMYALWSQGTGKDQGRSVAMLYLALVGAILCSAMSDAVSHGFSGAAVPGDASFFVMTILRVTSSIAALMLVHNLYTAAMPSARSALRMPMVALSAMWAYDLNLYTISYLTRGWSTELLQLRGIAMMLIVPIIALATHRDGKIQVRLSRTITFQSLSLVAIGAYLLAMILISSALDMIGGDLARFVQVAFVFLASVSGLVILPSAKFRAWARVKVSKHFYQHRYDYRAEWLRFNETLGRPGEVDSQLDTRIVKAIADITESPGGLLFVPDGTGGLGAQAHWNWAALDIQGQGQIEDAVALFGGGQRVVELDAVRSGGQDQPRLPDWLLDAPDAWAIVPLVHFDRLAGAVVLVRPPIDRTLDWEDFDLLRVAGRQAASYLAEARGQEALSEARRFDEFNRRFAFIMHDIKNLVSQLSLLTRNAEKHADNPEFRADMIATLQSSTARMNDLLARLSQHNKGRSEDPRTIPIRTVLDSVGRMHKARLTVSGDPALLAVADPVRLEQAIAHLVQNALDASPAEELVSLGCVRAGGDVCITVADHGHGMSPNFIRDKLYRPFTSTKDGGFGIGAFEARSLVVAMGGRLEVESREGAGTRFTISLPAVGQDQIIPFQTAPDLTKAKAA